MTNKYQSQIKNKINWIIGLLVIIGSIGLYPAKAAAGSLSLGIYPPIIKIDAIPPATIKTPITIQNLADENVTLKILFKPFTASEKEDGEVRYLTEKESYLLADPLIFQKIQIYDGIRRVENITLAPQQEKTLELHIGILKNDPLSDYYFSVIFISSFDSASDRRFGQETNTNFSSLSGGIATNVLLSIGPKGEVKGTIEEFSVPYFLEKGPVPFTLRVKNLGERVLAPKGEVLIKNMFGQLVGKVDLLPVNILAGTIRAIPDSFQSPEATKSPNHELGIMNDETPKAIWPESFLLGPYTATLRIALANEGPLFVRTINFVGLPIQAIVGLLLAILVTLFVINRVRSRLL